MIYQWKPSSQIDLDPEIAGQELERLRIKHNGRLTPEVVVKAASKKSSPLHDEFEWDDAEAAVQWRRDQARYLIRHLVVKIEDGKKSREARAFVSVVQDDAPHYTSLKVALSDEELRKQVLQRAWRELQSWRKQYEDLTELAPLFDIADEMAQDLDLGT